jgi:hypothetical protein
MSIVLPVFECPQAVITANVRPFNEFVSMRDRIGFLIPGDRPGVRSQSGALRYSISRLPGRKK